MNQQQKEPSRQVKRRMERILQKKVNSMKKQREIANRRKTKDTAEPKQAL